MAQPCPTSKQVIIKACPEPVEAERFGNLSIFEKIKILALSRPHIAMRLRSKDRYLRYKSNRMNK